MSIYSPRCPSMAINASIVLVQTNHPLSDGPYQRVLLGADKESNPLIVFVILQVAGSLGDHNTLHFYHQMTRKALILEGIRVLLGSINEYLSHWSWDMRNTFCLLLYTN